MIAICVCAYLYTYWQQNRPNDFWSHLKTSNTADRLVDKDEQIIIDHVNCFEQNEHEFLMRLLITKKNRPSQAIDLTTDINICDQRLHWHVNHFIYIWCKNFVCWFFKIIFSSYGDSVNFKKKKIVFKTDSPFVISVWSLSSCIMFKKKMLWLVWMN